MPILADAIFFSEATSTLAVAARLSKAKKTPLTDALLTVAEHLHAIIKEIRPTQKDWQETIAFLTEVGHACDEKRQEWVLLADLLGLSALVEEINSRRPHGATKNTVRGPFYRSDAPAFPLGANISLDGIGEPLTVSGIVQDLDGVRLAGATVETWQANSEGIYENQQPDLQPEFNLRGIFTTNLEGRFYYKTVKPAGYSVPDDGPVGQLLGKIGYPLRRPPHLHFLVKAKGYQSLTTQIFDGNDPHSREDALFGVKEGLLGDFRKIKNGSGMSESSLDLTFVLCAEKPEGGGRR
jgi:protocatechuate 3,4-dioxygenase beta subunit